MSGANACVLISSHLLLPLLPYLSRTDVCRLFIETVRVWGGGLRGLRVLKPANPAAVLNLSLSGSEEAPARPFNFAPAPIETKAMGTLIVCQFPLKENR